MKNNNHEITNSSGNIFADLQLDNPVERNAKAQLASKIYDHIEENGWNQTQAAAALGISQPDVSRLTRGILSDFSTDRLMRLLGNLHYRVSINVESENGPADRIPFSNPTAPH